MCLWTPVAKLSNPQVYSYTNDYRLYKSAAFHDIAVSFDLKVENARKIMIVSGLKFYRETGIRPTALT